MAKRRIATGLWFSVALSCISLANAGLDPDRFYIGTMCIATNAQSEAHFRDMHDCGIDYVLGLRFPTDEKYDLCAKYGIDVIEHRLSRWWATFDDAKWQKLLPLRRNDHQVEIDKMAGKRIHPAIKMLSIGDEPSALRYDLLAKSVAEVNRRMSNTPAFLNLNPSYGRLAESADKLAESHLGAVTYQDYIDQYCRKVPTDHISVDVYAVPERKTPKAIRYLEGCLHGSCQVISDACLRYGRTFWFMPQANMRPNADFPITANMMRHQAYVAMAYGAERLCWACWTPKEAGGGWWKENVLDEKGEKTPRYWMLKEVNADIHRIAKEFMRYRPIGTTLVGGDAEDELDAKGRVQIRRTVEFADGFVTGLKASDGSRLAVGARVSRHGGAERGRAYFVTACGDLVDEKRAVHEVVFSSVMPMRVLDADGPVPLTKRPDGTFAFQLADSRAVLIAQ